ncbi:hypothetical protein ACWIGW_44770 [Nocardia brasiliensis]|uniref:hypothetical protein n=1 Tax=Streptomyces sp. NPDC056056 TaxID=3345698 RepID=UPI0035D61B0F
MSKLKYHYDGWHFVDDECARERRCTCGFCKRDGWCDYGDCARTAVARCPVFNYPVCREHYGTNGFRVDGRVLYFPPDAPERQHIPESALLAPASSES